VISAFRGDAVGRTVRTFKESSSLMRSPQVLARQKQAVDPARNPARRQRVGLFVGDLSVAPAIGGYLKMSGSDQGVPNARLLFGDDAREVRLHFRAGLEIVRRLWRDGSQDPSRWAQQQPAPGQGENFGLGRHGRD